MVCPKCKTQLDEGSRFCKFCGAAAMNTVALQRAKKNYRLTMLPAVAGLLLLICGLIMVFQFSDPFETIGFVFMWVGISLVIFTGIFALITSLSAVFQARADKEASRDKLLQDLAKKLEDLESSQKQ